MVASLGPHAVFIVWSYVIGLGLIGLLAFWIMARQKAARRRLEGLEASIRAERNHG